MISLKHQFLFVHVPKTAGNAIQRSLLPYSEDTIVLTSEHHDGLERFEIRSPTLKVHKHSTLSDYQAQLPAGIYNALFKFSCTRNPWERCVSYFFSPHRGEVEWSPERFETFIVDSVAETESYIRLPFQQSNPFDNLDGIIRYDSLASDFEAICAKLGLPVAPLPRANASSREDYRCYYVNDWLVELVAKKFALEIDEFGYSFG